MATNITYQLPMIFSSSVLDGALNKSAHGSAFSVQLDRPILVPDTAKYCWIEVQAATVWNTVPNIITGVNDKFYFSIDDGMIVVNKVITIEQGIYDVVSLNAQFQRELSQIGLPNKFIQILADVPTLGIRNRSKPILA